MILLVLDKCEANPVITVKPIALRWKEPSLQKHDPQAAVSRNDPPDLKKRIESA
jgi:hypothetical protein